MTQVEKVSCWISNIKWDDIPQEVIHLAKLQVLDSLSAICAGSRSTVGIKLKRALNPDKNSGNSTLLPSGEKVNIDTALYYHSAMIGSLELDNLIYMGHISQSAIPAAISLTEDLGLSGKDLLLSFIIAQEVAGRLSAAFSNGPGQGHMRAFLHRIAASVVSAKLNKLNEEITAQSIAIALSMPELPLLPACFSPDTKVICTCAPLIEGIRAVEMAKQNMDAPLDIIENPNGLYKNFTFSRYLPDIWKSVGQTWTISTLSVKKYATCAYAQGPVIAATNIMNGQVLKPEEIDRIDIFCPMGTMILEDFSKAHYKAGLTPVNTHFSVRRSVAATFLYGKLTGDFYRSGNFENKTSTIDSVARKASLYHDWQMTINLLKGVDEGLTNPGKYGFLGMTNANKTLKGFRTALGSRPLLQWSDVSKILKLPLKDQAYYLRRYWNSLVSLLQLTFLAKQESFFASEGDLSKMSFKLSGKVRICLTDGRKMEEYCELPDGFSGSPLREQTIMEKYDRESVPLWGVEKSLRIKENFMRLDKIPSPDIFRILKS
jgi:2-methylcitrate dehydratase PrpD